MGSIKTKEEARKALDEANAVVTTAVLMLKGVRPIFDQFAEEERRMNSVGAIFDPTLFNNSERRATAALLEPLYTAATRFIDIYDVQIAAAASALSKVVQKGAA